MLTSRRGFIGAAMALVGVRLVGVELHKTHTFPPETGTMRSWDFGKNESETYYSVHPVGWRLFTREGWQWHCTWCKAQAHGSNYGRSSFLDTTNGTIYTDKYYTGVVRPWTWRQWGKEYRRG